VRFGTDTFGHIDASFERQHGTDLFAHMFPEWEATHASYMEAACLDLNKETWVYEGVDWQHAGWTKPVLESLLPVFLVPSWHRGEVM
jgi:hypothetical protein